MNETYSGTATKDDLEEFRRIWAEIKNKDCVLSCLIMLKDKAHAGEEVQ